MEEQQLEREWQALTEEVLTGMRDWRAAHPEATFAELEAAVEERLGRLRGHMLQAAALACAGQDMADGGAGEPCPECGQRLVVRGQHERELIIQGDQPVRLQRRYLVCPACGAGLFPPG